MREGTAAGGVPSCLWGKALGDGPDHHPLLFHMLDVGHVALALLETAVSARGRVAIGASSGLSPLELSFLVALHDLGKASPAFQLKRPDIVAPLEARLPWPSNRSDAARDRTVHHGVVGAASLPAALETVSGMDPVAARRVASAVCGHHGAFADFTETEQVRKGARKVRSGVGVAEWDQLRLEICQELQRSLGARSLSGWNPDGATCFLLAGLTSVADWIGSNEVWFPYEPELEIESYLGVSRGRAREALRRLGLEHWKPRSQSFEERFGFAPRPAQAAADRVARTIGEPAIVVIEAEMGSGKTETAFNFAAEWVRSGQASGTYVALPTRATSNQMFSRAVRFIERSTGTESAQVQLVHGLARLTSDFEQLLGVEPFETVELSAVFDEDTTTVVRAEEWFTSRKRSLLSTWGVGTVDALLVAALRVRHGFVRLFGLFDKVVVIDEVHAYDLYMSTLLDRLLQWLGHLRVPVVLLSATLPEGRREQLLSAWSGRRVELDVGYPGISWASATGEGAETVPASLSRSVTLDLRSGTVEPAEIASVLVNASTEGGCVLGVCNTVRRAQDTYLAVRAALNETGRSEDVEVHLLHARFLFGDRDAKEQLILEAFGPTGQRPDRAIVVATQVVEQSLDLDFDLIVSDLAPVDLLLQRMGRLHRHERDRPDCLVEPTLVVAGFERLSDGTLEFPAGSVTVYGHHLLVRTAAWLGDRAVINVPEDLPVLVNGVYGDSVVPDHRLIAQAAAALTEHEAQQQHEATEAQLRYLPSPAELTILSSATSQTSIEDDPDTHLRLQALTRLTGPSVNVVALTVDGDCVTCGPDGQVVDLVVQPDRNLTRALLNRSVSLTQPGLVRAITLEDVPSGWATSNWLSHHRAILFDRSGTARVGPWDLSLDPDLGLLVDRRSKDIAA